MSAAQPIGDWFPSDYLPGAFTTHGSFSPRLLASLNDPEDDPPNRQSRFYMPHEEREDFRRAETLVPPTESTPPPAERDTLPPDPPAEEAAAEAELARVGDTLRPPQRRTEPPKSGSFEEAARLFGENLIEMRETRREIAAGFTSHGAHLGIIETEVRRVNARLTGLEGDIVDVRSEMRREIASLRKRLDELERKAGSA